MRRFILAALAVGGILCGLSTQCLATVMTFTGIVSQVSVTSNLGNFAVGNPVLGSVTFDPPRAYSVNVSVVNIAGGGENFETQIQNDPKKGFVLYHLQFFGEPAFPYESADGGFDLVGYSPTGTRPPIETFAINDFSISFRGDFDGDGREDVESVEGRLTSLVVVPDSGMSLVLMGLGLLAVSSLDRKGWTSSRVVE